MALSSQIVPSLEPLVDAAAVAITSALVARELPGLLFLDSAGELDLEMIHAVHRSKDPRTRRPTSRELGSCCS